MLRRHLRPGLVLASLGCALLGGALCGCDSDSDESDDPELAVPGTEVPENPAPPQPGDLPPGYQPNDEWTPRLGVPGVAVPEAPTPPMPPGMIPPGMPPGAGGPIVIAPGFQPDPMVVPGAIMATVPASNMAQTCAGFVGPAPSHVLQIQSPIPLLRIMVNSPQDTAIVIRGADGTILCNDDEVPGQTLNPLIQGSFQPGTYQIFVGAYNQGTQGPYSLGLTETQHVQSAQLPIQAPPGGAGMPPGAAPRQNGPPGAMQPMAPSP